MDQELESQYPWLNSLLYYFQNLNKIDDEIELLRVALCENSQFSPLSLFNYLDINGKSFLTLNDFKLFLSSKNSLYDERKLRKMIHNFDKDNDFSLNMNEFLGLILPRKNKILQKKICCSAETYGNNNNNVITQEIINNFNELILGEMKLVQELDKISLEIKNSKIFSTYEAFLAIVGDDKYMTKLNLFNFLKKNNKFINDEEVAQLMFRLDGDNDDKISYEEFKEIFYPINEDFVCSSKNGIDINENKYIYNENFNNKEYNNNEFTKNYNNYNYNTNDCNNNYNNKEYNNMKNDYNNYNSNYYNKDYINKDFSNNNYKNDYFNNKDDFKNNNYKNIVNDYEYINNSERDPNKREKKTKKIILRPAIKEKYNTNPNELYSLQLTNNKKEKLFSKYPNKNNINTNDNNNNLNIESKHSYIKILKNRNSSSYNNYNRNDNNNRFKYISKINQKSLNLDKSNNNKYSTINLNNEEPFDKNDINNYYINSSLLKNKNKRIFSLNNNEYNEYKNEDDKVHNHNHNHERGNCKACLLSARNIYKDYKDKKTNDNPIRINERISIRKINRNKSTNNFHSNTLFFDRNNNTSINENTLFRDRSTNNIDFNTNRNNPNNDIYKLKDELLRKYGDYNSDYNINYKNKSNCKCCKCDNTSKNNYIFNSEEDISTNVNFISQKNVNLNNQDDKENFDQNSNKENRVSQINFPKKIIQSRYVTPLRIINSNSNNNKKLKGHLFREKSRIINDTSYRNKSIIFSTPISPIQTTYNKFNRVLIKENNVSEKKNLLFKLLQNYIEKENKLQNIKQYFANCPNSEIQNIFETFNISKKNCIYCSDFCEVLNCLYANCNCNFSFYPDNIKYIFRKYNKPFQCGFKYDEFCNIILPKKKIENIFYDNENITFNNDINQNTKSKIVELFIELIEGEKSIDEIRNMISIASNNIFFDLFGEIKKVNMNGIQSDDISKFMKENDHQVKYDEIDIIMERMDKNKDGIIDYQEFINEIQP